MTEQDPSAGAPNIAERVLGARFTLDAVLGDVPGVYDLEELRQAEDTARAVVVTAENLVTTAAQRRREVVAEQKEAEEFDKIAVRLYAATFRFALGRHRINAAELRTYLENPEEDDRFFDFHGMSDEDFAGLFAAIREDVAEDTGAEWVLSGPEDDEHWSLIPLATEEKTIEAPTELEDTSRPPAATPEARPVGVTPGEALAIEAPPTRQPQPPKRERQPRASDPAFTADEVQKTRAVLDAFKGQANVGGVELAKLAKAVGDNEKATRALIARLIDRGILSREAQKGTKRGVVIRRAVAPKEASSAVAALSQPFHFE